MAAPKDTAPKPEAGGERKVRATLKRAIWHIAAGLDPEDCDAGDDEAIEIYKQREHGAIAVTADTFGETEARVREFVLATRAKEKADATLAALMGKGAK